MNGGGIFNGPTALGGKIVGMGSNIVDANFRLNWPSKNDGMCPCTPMGQADGEKPATWPLWALLIGGIGLALVWNTLTPKARPNRGMEYWIVVKKRGRILSSAGPVIGKRSADRVVKELRKEQSRKCGYSFSARKTRPDLPRIAARRRRRRRR